MDPGQFSMGGPNPKAYTGYGPPENLDPGGPCSIREYGLAGSIFYRGT